MDEKNAVRIYINRREKITLQTLLATEIRGNEECCKNGIVPCFKTNDLKNLYKKVAGYEYNEEEW